MNLNLPQGNIPSSEVDREIDREMDLLTFLICFLFIWTLARALFSIGSSRRSAASKRLPPGPFPFPVVGSLFKLGTKPHKSLAELAKSHGPLMTLRLGQSTTVVVSTAAMASEVLHKQDISFSTRTIPDALRAHQHSQFSVAWLPVSSKWRNLRKICNSYIFTTQRLEAGEQLRRRKVEELLEEVGESCRIGRAVNVGRVAFRTTLNLLSNVIFSVDLTDSSSDSAREFKQLVWMIMEDAGKPNVSDYFPVLANIDPQGIRRRLTAHFAKMINVFDFMIDQRLESRKVNDSNACSDVLDALLNLSQNLTGSENTNRTEIQHLFLDLFAAGTDTTSSTLEWAMAELLHNPQALAKAQAELEETIGDGNQVRESDIDRLPYLQAVVKETFRLHPPVPLLLPRRVETDVEVCGFTVPSGAQVLVNAWAIGRDATTWDNPNSFVPERFLGSEMDVKGHHFDLIPFGAGRRICPGLPLAIRMIHLVLGSLLHSFGWKLEDGIAAEDMDMEEKFGLTLQMAQPPRAVPFGK